MGSFFHCLIPKDTTFQFQPRNIKNPSSWPLKQRNVKEKKGEERKNSEELNKQARGPVDLVTLPFMASSKICNILERKCSMIGLLMAKVNI